MGRHSAVVLGLKAAGARESGLKWGGRPGAAAEYLRTRTEAAQRSASELRMKPAPDKTRGRPAGELRSEASPIRLLYPMAVRPSNMAHLLPIQARASLALRVRWGLPPRDVPSQRAPRNWAAAHRREGNGVGGAHMAQIRLHRRRQARRAIRASFPIRNLMEAERRVAARGRAELVPVPLSPEGPAEERIQAGGRLEPAQ